MNYINILTKMTKGEIIKHLHKALNSVDITFPYRYVLVEAIEALSQFSFPLDINNAAEEYSLDVKAKPYENLVKEAFKDGATWRDSQIPELPSNLDEAAEEQYPDFSNSIASKAAVDSMRDAFKAGAEWQKTQMIKEAVEGVVCYGSKEAYIETDFLGTEDTEVYGMPGDKVRIVIVKEENK